MRYWKPRKVPGNPRVTMIVASYLNDDPRRVAALGCLLASLEAQTYPNWNAVVVHDGPLTATRNLDRHLEAFREVWHWSGDRVRLVETEARLGQAGHPHRHRYAVAAEGEFVGFCNDDVYYAPTYFEWLLSELIRTDADMAYCDMVHSHQMWRPFPTQPLRGRIDVGCFLARRSLVASVPWTDYSFSGDGRYIEALNRHARRVVKVAATLYVHN